MSVVTLYVWHVVNLETVAGQEALFVLATVEALGTALLLSLTRSEFAMLANVNRALYIYTRAAPAEEEVGNKSPRIKPNNDIVYLFSISLSICCVPSLTLGHVEAFSQRASEPLPLLPRPEKSQTLSFGRVQEITVYISSCITSISKLSVFFFPPWSVWGGNRPSNTIKAGAYHKSAAPVPPSRGGSHLYHHCFAPSQLFLFMRLTSDLTEAEPLLDVSGEEAVQRKIGWEESPTTRKPSSHQPAGVQV